MLSLKRPRKAAAVPSEADARWGQWKLDGGTMALCPSVGPLVCTSCWPFALNYSVPFGDMFHDISVCGIGRRMKQP